MIPPAPPVTELGPVGTELRACWQLRVEGGAWQPAEIGVPWQRWLPGFAGVACYWTRLCWRDPEPVRLRFEAVATEASVLLDGVELARHTGAWTPFVVDLTPALESGRTHELVVRVDQKPEHTTAGFLPRIGGAFGGIWGGVRRVANSDAAPGPGPADASDWARGVVADGERLIVDGRPLQVRGLLHWGAYPELGAPRPSRPQIEREVDWMLELGFNLVKMCLFLPPEEYLEVCEQRGLWVWQEYPIWDRPLRDSAVRAELEEMLRRDRHRRCVILRSLTCENARFAPDLARRLYRMAKRIAPRGLVVDNSSFFGMHVACDFWDEHPYLDNLAWRRYPDRVRQAVAARSTKPVLLGETMAVDAFDGPPRAVADRSRRLAVAVRRTQTELLRRELPFAGYVLNAFRDIEGAPLGLCRRDGTPRFAASDWSWQRDAVLLCDLGDRSFEAGGRLRVAFSVSHFGPERLAGPLRVQCGDQRAELPAVRVANAGLTPAGALELRLPAVAEPTPLWLTAALGPLEQRWRLWIVPPAPPPDPHVRVAAPRAGSWRCPTFHWLSPVPWLCEGVSAAEPVAAMLVDLLLDDLMSGRVLQPHPALQPLLEVWDVHDQRQGPRRLPLVGLVREPRPAASVVWSALRHDTPAGRWLLGELARWRHRQPPDPAATPVPASDSLDLDCWHMEAEAAASAQVRTGAGVTLEGRAHFHTHFDTPAGWAATGATLRCAGIGDGYRLSVDGRPVGSAGNLDAAWDTCRHQIQDWPLQLGPGRHEVTLEVHEWCGGGAMLGPVLLTRTPDAPYW